MKQYGAGMASQVRAPASPVKMPKFAGVPSKYLLTDQEIYPRARSTVSTELTEFEKYTNALPSPLDTDLVTFWQVFTIFSYIIDVFHNFIDK